MVRRMKNVHVEDPMLFEEILLHNPPPLRIHFHKVPTDKVEFDPENPRLKYRKQLFPGKSDQELIFDKDDTRFLSLDIKQNGVIDPIYVRPLANGTYRVTEGNRRTAVMKDLRAKNPDNPQFAFIPARILPAETTKQQEALLMASFHVAGKVKWDAHEKAGHIWEMLNVLNIPESELINTLHMGAPAIKKAAESYGLLRRYQAIDGGRYASQAEGKWSFFAEMVKAKVFYKKHKDGQDFGDLFCRWVGEERIPRAEDVRALAKMWENKKARAVFENAPPGTAFKEAVQARKKEDPATDSKFYKDVEKFNASAKMASVADIDEASDNENAREIITLAYGRLVAFMDKAGISIPGSRTR